MSNNGKRAWEASPDQKDSTSGSETAKKSKTDKEPLVKEDRKSFLETLSLDTFRNILHLISGEKYTPALTKLKMLKEFPGVKFELSPEVAAVIPQQHAKEVVYTVLKKKVEDMKNPESKDLFLKDDEVFFKENADIIPPEVAVAFSFKKRRQVAEAIRDMRKKGEKPPAPIYVKDDEAFIEENLHLVPRAIAELMNSTERRKLVSILLKSQKKMKEEIEVDSQKRGNTKVDSEGLEVLSHGDEVSPDTEMPTVDELNAAAGKIKTKTDKKKKKMRKRQKNCLTNY